MAPGPVYATSHSIIDHGNAALCMFLWSSLLLISFSSPPHSFPLIISLEAKVG